MADEFAKEFTKEYGTNSKWRIHYVKRQTPIDMTGATLYLRKGNGQGTNAVYAIASISNHDEIDAEAKNIVNMASNAYNLKFTLKYISLDLRCRQRNCNTWCNSSESKCGLTVVYEDCVNMEMYEDELIPKIKPKMLREQPWYSRENGERFVKWGKVKLAGIMWDRMDENTQRQAARHNIPITPIECSIRVVPESIVVVSDDASLLKSAYDKFWPAEEDEPNDPPRGTLSRKCEQKNNLAKRRIQDAIQDDGKKRKFDADDLLDDGQLEV